MKNVSLNKRDLESIAPKWLGEHDSSVWDVCEMFYFALGMRSLRGNFWGTQDTCLCHPFCFIEARFFFLYS